MMSYMTEFLPLCPFGLGAGANSLTINSPSMVNKNRALASFPVWLYHPDVAIAQQSPGTQGNADANPTVHWLQRLAIQKRNLWCAAHTCVGVSA